MGGVLQLAAVVTEAVARGSALGGQGSSGSSCMLPTEPFHLVFTVTEAWVPRPCNPASRGQGRLGALGERIGVGSLQGQTGRLCAGPWEGLGLEACVCTHSHAGQAWTEGPRAGARGKGLEL